MKRFVLFIVSILLTMVGFGNICVSAFESPNPTYASYIPFYEGTFEIIMPYNKDLRNFPAEIETSPYFELDPMEKWLMVDGSFVPAKVIIENGRTLIPARTVVEKLGAQVDWDSDERRITITKDSTLITLIENEKVANVNGSQVVLDAAVKIQGGVTYIPLRFVSEALEGKAEYFGGITHFQSVVWVESKEFTSQAKETNDASIMQNVQKILGDAFDEKLENQWRQMEEYNPKLAIYTQTLASQIIALEVEAHFSCYSILGSEHLTFLVNNINGDIYMSDFRQKNQDYLIEINPEDLARIYGTAFIIPFEKDLFDDAIMYFEQNYAFEEM